ncbi:MAG TPA: hypothetical protein VJ875_16145 [Pyrinomonadaceae bacterium]|nr:hypothetical protein [Pyrinomonadaceae bacterium]
MNTIRCFFLGAILVISSATLALGGDMQGPGKSDPPPPPPSCASTADSSTDGMIAPTPTSTEAIQIAWQDLTTAMLTEILFTIF